MQYEPGVFPIANLENAGQMSRQIKGAKQKHYTNNENMYNMSHGISGYSALAAMFGREDGSRAQGALYDIQNFQNLYQDKLRTVPVTALEQPVGSVTDISGNGNHAYQATAGNRPIVSAKYNLLLATENLNSGVWIKDAGAIVNGTFIPDTADTIHRIRQPLLAELNLSYKVKGRLKGEGIRYVNINTNATLGNRVTIDTQTGETVGTAGTVSGLVSSLAADGWIDFEYGGIGTGTAGNYIWFQANTGAGPVDTPYVGNAVDGFRVSKVDVRLASDAALNIPKYQRVNTATDYDSAGFPRYLKGDGVSQFLQTDAINFTGTDKMTVIAGVTKLSDAARQIVFECPNVGAGNFAMNAPNGPGLTTIVFAAGGSISSAAQPSIGSVPAPVNKVVGATADIAGDNATLYIDGVQVSSVTADMGTGNFSNGPLYIFARDGLSLFSSGRLYGLAICGRQIGPYPLFLASEELGSKMGIELS